MGETLLAATQHSAQLMCKHVQRCSIRVSCGYSACQRAQQWWQGAPSAALSAHASSNEAPVGLSGGAHAAVLPCCCPPGALLAAAQ